MRKLSLIFVLFFAYFCCILNVYAESTDSLYVIGFNQFFDDTGVKGIDYYNYSNFNNNVRLFGSNALGSQIIFHSGPLTSLSNKYLIKGSFTVTFYNQPILVPDQDLNSCLYLAQNSPNERAYLSNCFNINFNSNFASTQNLRLSVTPSEAISVDTSEDGNVTVDVLENGYQYTFGYSIEVTMSEVNRDYYLYFAVTSKGGYFHADSHDVVNVLITTPEISVIPYFTAENSMFGTFFNSLNFNFQGLTSIITTPVAFINNLKSDPPSQLSFSVFNKSISIKNGELLFWGRPDVSSFRTFWNFFVGGFIIYLVYKRLYKFIYNLFNPDSNEVVDL